MTAATAEFTRPPEPGSVPTGAAVSEARTCATRDEAGCHRHETD